MPEKTSIHLDALNIRLTGQDPSVAAALVRDLPGALERAFTAGRPARSESLADTVAAQVAEQVRLRSREG